MCHTTFAKVTNWVSKAWESINPQVITATFKKVQLIEDEKEDADDTDEDEEL